MAYIVFHHRPTQPSEKKAAKAKGKRVNVLQIIVKAEGETREEEKEKRLTIVSL